jgi:phage terminase small subunit
MDPPADLPEAQVIVWRHVIANQAAGVFRPIDTGALRQYAWFLSHELAAEHEFEAWASAPKKTGETPFLKRARNGALVAHPLLAVIRDLHDHVLKLEVVLGLTPVARERIHASVQGELFGGGDPRDPWASFKTPDEQKAN